MQASTRQALPERLHVLAALAHLLESLERSPRTASAEQFRTVVQHVATQLAQAESDEFLDALLEAYPATAEVYENLRYEHAGLCRSPFDNSLGAEMQAVTLIERARRAA